jgi:hypothetical protein
MYRKRGRGLVIAVGIMTAASVLSAKSNDLRTITGRAWVPRAAPSA